VSPTKPDEPKFSFQWHSLLIKKINKDEFIFFDPNSGEKRGLSKKELTHEINNQITQWKATDIYFTDGKKYLEKLRNRRIIGVTEQTFSKAK
jgi:hypothetical protein